MSSRNNDVFQILPTKGNTVVLAAGNTEAALAVGQIGFFDVGTGLSITTGTPRGFYIALGIDTNGGSTLNDIRRSAGQFIQVRPKGVVGYSYKPHTAGRPQIEKVGNYKAQCDTDYAIKVELRNSKIARLQGHIQFVKTYAVRTACCDGCAEGCDTSDANLLTRLIVNEINNDIDGMVTAQIVARQALTIATHGVAANYSAGDVMVDADIDALVAYNALQTDEADKVYTDFILTPAKVPYTNPTSVVDLHHFSLLETSIVVSLIDGFNCTGEVTNVQTLVYEEGAGKNIRQKEYMASSWNGSGPYVLQDIGIPRDIPYLSVASGVYDQFALEYAFVTESGWLEYENPLATIIAVPEADTVTRNSVATVLDALLTGLGFEALADDAAAASATSTVVEPVVSDVTKDGLA